MLAYPSEVMALQERVTRLEAENQRLREIISDKADQESYLVRKIERLTNHVEALRSEILIRKALA